MLDHYLGISKQNFLDHHVVPANDNDAFYNDKCIVCWDPYDDGHPAVRVLPCNHVFGHQCLLMMVDAPKGECCPICRVSLFRPALFALLSSWEQAFDDYLGALMLPAILKLMVLVEACMRRIDAVSPILGRVVRWVCWIWMAIWIKARNPFFYVSQLVNRFTNLRQRNAQLDLPASQLAFRKWMSYLGIVGPFVGKFVHVPFAVKFPAVVIAITIYNMSIMTSRKDRFVFCFIVLISLAMGFSVAAFSPIRSFGLQL